MRVLALPRYGPMGASSRMRMIQYCPRLRADGIAVELMPLFDDHYLEGLQAGKRNVGNISGAYARRLIDAQVRIRGADLLWIEKDALPWLPAVVEKSLLLSSRPYVLDYDDAVFHLYDGHRSGIVRGLLGRKHESLMRNAAVVVAGNDYLANYARRAGAKRVEIIPTVIDLARYPCRRATPQVSVEQGPRIGWIGQRSTAPFLHPLKSVFQRMVDDGAARFCAVGIDAAEFGLPMESRPWHERSEVSDLASFDIGIMPLSDGPFERGKCGYKLIQYMASGLPVVASPVGVNSRIVDHGVNGLLAEGEAEWEKALRILAADAALRARMGEAGRKKVQEHFCLAVTSPRLAGVLRSAVESPAGA